MGRNRLLMILDADAKSRERTVDLLRDAPYAVVADTDYGREAHAIAEETQPELLLAAIEHPIDDSLRTVQEIASSLSACEVVVYSSQTDMKTMRQVLQAGVRDLLPQPLNRSELLQALDAIEPLERAAVDWEAEGALPTSPPHKTAGQVLTVFGAKGGIGKSTIATNLGASIATDTEHSVLVMDMDTRFGDIAIMLDMEPQYTIADLAPHAETMDRDTFRRALMQHDSGAHVLAAPKHPSEWGTITSEHMQRLVKYAAGLFDYVILDTPGTFNDIVATSIEVADRVLVVSSLDMASIKDTVHMLDLLEGEGFPADRLLLIINQVNRATTIRVTDVPRIVHQEVFWAIPYDEQVILSNSLGRPIVQAKPKSGASRQLRGLAQKVAGPSDAAQQKNQRSWALGNVFNPWMRLLRRATA